MIIGGLNYRYDWARCHKKSAAAGTFRFISRRIYRVSRINRFRWNNRKSWIIRVVRIFRIKRIRWIKMEWGSFGSLYGRNISGFIIAVLRNQRINRVCILIRNNFCQLIQFIVGVFFGYDSVGFRYDIPVCIVFDFLGIKGVPVLFVADAGKKNRCLVSFCKVSISFIFFHGYIFYAINRLPKVSIIETLYAYCLE